MAEYEKNKEYWIRFEGAGPFEPHDKPGWIDAIGRYYESGTKSCFITAEWGEVPVEAVKEATEIDAPVWAGG